MIKCDHCEGWGLVYKPMKEAVNLVKCRECFGFGKILDLSKYDELPQKGARFLEIVKRVGPLEVVVLASCNPQKLKDEH